ncbi:DUF1566 domain-containing protein [Paraburkholderia caballeronis]|uniref:DUF1566 domain-containing protein n=1 Tax=Paraburkholderia caballeronis TaxID=416943 RepID=UPI0010648F77|nr:DUF1566 domain-containing protein [Paraburkholderia caballeronis]TDV04656.1 hypothetical protein C7408_13118 [Paraburkholderia caballeronis]TDV07899.1 hypothetical protein C7406_13318 [Paraburkholderia caballeronis]TDV18190.1 hypothetical protein C7404_13118 [Paraburkholderia caballeronis]
MTTTIESFLKSIGAPTIGEYWEGQGGALVNLRPADDSEKLSFLICSTDEARDLEWGSYGKRVKGADDRYDGRANTLALVNAATSHPAAEWCAEYSKDGHSEFYLPAQRELNLAYASCPRVFSPEWYWSSTQFSATNAWDQTFGGGYQYGALKTRKGRVRAFRRFSI